MPTNRLFLCREIRRCWMKRFAAISCALLSLLLLPRTVSAQAAPPAGASEVDGPSYLVSELVIVYLDPNPQFPSPEEMSQLVVEVGQGPDGMVAPRAGVPSKSFRMADLPSMGTQKMYASAIRAINQQLVFDFNRRDFHAIVVSPLPEDIERRTGRDLRPEGQTRLNLGVYAGRVRDMRTFATGERLGEDENKLDRPEHAWILAKSPIRTEPPDDLLRKDQLDSYIARLNRHPSRRVDAEISPARTAGGVNLDYMIAENKPWYAYAQIENTGTEETTKLRQRFGFVDYQTFGRDDILQLDYVTGNFDQVHGVVGSYEAPFVRGGRFRGRVFGTYSEYDASVLGLEFAGDAFHGTQTDAGVQLIANVFQYKEFFVDALLGARWQRLKAVNELAPSNVAEPFALGLAGVRLERYGTTSTLTGELTFERNFPDIAGTNPDQLQDLGRPAVGLNPQEWDDFAYMRWDFDFSFFVEPFLAPRTWRQPSAFETHSLAHEIFFSFQGQQSLNAKLVPQHQAVVGGLYTVRGYPEAAAVGDDVTLFTAEYRLHIPRLLKPGGKPVEVPVLGKFRARPEYQYSFADWDLMFRAFWDIAKTGYYEPVPGEVDETLSGVGVGLELRVQRYLTARLDWGFALNSINQVEGETTDGSSVNKGENEVHFSVRVLY